MKPTVGDFILQRLTDWGVKRVFGYPGDGINGLMGAMGRAADRFDYVRVRHEEMAAFMAGATACAAVSAPVTLIRKSALTASGDTWVGVPGVTPAAL